MKRMLCGLLALVFIFGLVACDVGVASGNGGDRNEDGSWDGVDFKGQKVSLCISANQYMEVTFPAADIYTKGPDTAGTNEVAKEVLARNARAAEELGIEIVYTERDIAWDGIHEDLRRIVQTASETSPDIYNNDSYGLSRAMVDGLLWNVKNPGNGVKNYFDFEAEGWYLEFMKGCTFNQDKYYLFASDYFIDMIRMAWVVFVNHDIFSANLNKMPKWCDDLDTFYDYVQDGFWDMDMLAEIAGAVFTEGAGGLYGTTEKTDVTVGFAYCNNSKLVFSAASGVTVYYQDKENGYTPKVMDSIDTYQRVANTFVEMTKTKGVYYEPDTIVPTNCFLQGNFLFAISRLGEMESSALRDFKGNKGLVPVPKWNDNEQDEYHTVLHDQVEIGCILNTAKAFSASSALMQFMAEESKQVVYAYYDKGLKYKYNDDENARAMMDLVRNTTDSPFGFQIGVLCQTLYTGPTALEGIYLNHNTTISSTFASEKDAYLDCMATMLAKFDALE